MSKLNILIVDDYPIFREGLCAILSKIPGVEVIGEAENGQVAIEKARQLKPHLILMDLTMPVMSGEEAIRIIKQHQSAIKICALTARNTHHHVEAALAAGADAYVLKDDSSLNLLTAIESIRNGQNYFSPGISNTVLSAYLDNAGNVSSTTPRYKLTEREREVIKLVAEGYKNREIATHLSLSIKTVEKHRSKLMNKLNLRGVSALTDYAIEYGLCHNLKHTE